MREACKRGWSQVVELEMRKGKPSEPPKKKSRLDSDAMDVDE